MTELVKSRVTDQLARGDWFSRSVGQGERHTSGRMPACTSAPEEGQEGLQELQRDVASQHPGEMFALERIQVVFEPQQSEAPRDVDSGKARALWTGYG